MKQLISRLRDYSSSAESLESAYALERLNADNGRLSNLLQGNTMYLEAELSERTTERDLALERGAEYSEQVAKQDLKIERLTAENLRLAGEVSNRNSRALAGDTATKQFDAMYEDIERLTAERDALRADAERYEFLRNNFATKSEDSVDDFIALEPMTGDCFDAHIDLLMEEFERAKK